MKWLWVSAVVLILDQWSKWLADATLALYESVELVPYLALRKAYNSGAAFSFLSGASGWQRWFFSVLAIVIITVLFIWLQRLSANEKLARLGLVMILGGAVGNLIDRLVYGHVIDFIDVYYGSWHFPTFNVADAAISVGAGLLLLDAFTNHKQTTSTG